MRLSMGYRRAGSHVGSHQAPGTAEHSRRTCSLDGLGGRGALEGARRPALLARDGQGPAMSSRPGAGHGIAHGVELTAGFAVLPQICGVGFCGLGRDSWVYSGLADANKACAGSGETSRLEHLSLLDLEPVESLDCVRWRHSSQDTTAA